MEHKDLAIDYFERHPSNDECHITSDNRVFHNKGGAESFAGTLDDKKISSFERKLVMKKDPENKEATKEADKKEKTPAEILAMEVFLQKAEVEKLDYKDLKKLVQFFEIKTADQKAETLIAALTEFKTTLNK